MILCSSRSRKVSLPVFKLLIGKARKYAFMTLDQVMQIDASEPCDEQQVTMKVGEEE